MNILGNLLGKLVGGDAGAKVVDYFNKKQELKQQLQLKKLEGKIALEEHRQEVLAQQIKADSDWELAQIANSGWKDEYVLGVLSIPLLLVFIPWTQNVVMEGFGVLEQTPSWYRWMVVMIFCATYGIRVWKRTQKTT